MTDPQPAPPHRRVHRRYPLRVSGNMMLPGGAAVRIRTLDIGIGGAGVVCDVNIPAGTPVSLRMMLPSRMGTSSPFEGVAVVVNSALSASTGGFRVGLRFGPLQPPAVAALKGALPESFGDAAS